MNDSFVFWVVCVLIGAGVLIGAMIGYGSNAGHQFSNCIKYHEKMSVVEANALCDKIVRGGK